MLSLIATAKLNDIDPQAWLADVHARIAQSRLHDLLPYNWNADYLTVQQEELAAGFSGIKSTG